MSERANGFWQTPQVRMSWCASPSTPSASAATKRRLTCNTILKCDLHMHAYRLSSVQELLSNDQSELMQFSKWFMGCPSGSDGDANSLMWMVEKNFVKFVRHFIKFSRCSKERSVLMLLDNHDSHLSIEALDLLKDNGVVAISCPPRCSHKLQPLDRSGFGMGMPTCPGHGIELNIFHGEMVEEKPKHSA
ncbi:hypothetical protein NQ318_019417 [Aromia moschata]|uniref:DDE-1 domain-containing protein n=1 Tax=Aromia moschata TaxID=1265417 RepID=A0AAV8XK43_9CUCU|nr:hypothetical protein NQ318_019417 [Aromia moschata]